MAGGDEAIDDDSAERHAHACDQHEDAGSDGRSRGIHRVVPIQVAGRPGDDRALDEHHQTGRDVRAVHRPETEELSNDAR
jgi:hypothetical protein